jgi:hypothetical protein
MYNAWLLLLLGCSQASHFPSASKVTLVVAVASFMYFVSMFVLSICIYGGSCCIDMLLH